MLIILRTLALFSYFSDLVDHIFGAYYLLIFSLIQTNCLLDLMLPLHCLRWGEEEVGRKEDDHFENPGALIYEMDRWWVLEAGVGLKWPGLAIGSLRFFFYFGLAFGTPGVYILELWSPSKGPSSKRINVLINLYVMTMDSVKMIHVQFKFVRSLFAFLCFMDSIKRIHILFKFVRVSCLQCLCLWIHS